VFDNRDPRRKFGKLDEITGELKKLYSEELDNL
jgi:hypothetical protein